MRMVVFDVRGRHPRRGFLTSIDNACVGLYVAAGTSAHIVSKLHDAVMRALATAEVQQRFEDLDYVPSRMSQQQADAFYRNEIARWKDVAKNANIPFVD
jgi:tripartite-type tricarboxylate transporter receptor subunit TctC